MVTAYTSPAPPVAAEKYRCLNTPKCTSDETIMQDALGVALFCTSSNPSSRTSCADTMKSVPFIQRLTAGGCAVVASPSTELPSAPRMSTKSVSTSKSGIPLVAEWYCPASKRIARRFVVDSAFPNGSQFTAAS